MKNRKCPDAVVEKNRELLLQRSIFGISKYGTTIANNPLSLKEWLNHALMECLDQANYLQAAISKIEKQEKEVLQAMSVGFRPLEIKQYRRDHGKVKQLRDGDKRSQRSSGSSRRHTNSRSTKNSKVSKH